MIFYFAIIALCVLLQAFFAGLEIAFLSCDRFEIRHWAYQKNLRARWVGRFLSRPVDYLATTMIGVNVAVVVSASLATALARNFFSPTTASLVATFCLWPVVLLLGEFIPMSLALSYPSKVALWGVSGLKIAYFIFYPFVRLIGYFSHLVNRMLGGRSDLAEPYFTRDELRLLFRGAGKKVFDPAQENMVHGVFKFHRVKVREIMVPLKEVVSCPIEAKVGDLKKKVFDTAFSRIPIYNRLPTQIVGTVHAMDLIGLEDEVPIDQVMKIAFRISPASSVGEVLKVMKKNQTYMGIVTDLYGRSLGVVTMEDIIEEIVGEIEDEYDVRAGD